MLLLIYISHFTLPLHYILDKSVLAFTLIYLFDNLSYYLLYRLHAAAKVTHVFFLLIQISGAVCKKIF